MSSPHRIQVPTSHLVASQQKWCICHIKRPPLGNEMLASCTFFPKVLLKERIRPNALRGKPMHGNYWHCPLVPLNDCAYKKNVGHHPRYGFLSSPRLHGMALRALIFYTVGYDIERNTWCNSKPMMFPCLTLW